METIITKDDNHVGDNDGDDRNDGDEDFEHWSSLLQGCLVHFWRPANAKKPRSKSIFTILSNMEKEKISNATILGRIK